MLRGISVIFELAMYISGSDRTDHICHWAVRCGTSKRASADSEKLRKIREADAWAEYRHQRAGALRQSEEKAGDEPVETYGREVKNS